MGDSIKNFNLIVNSDVEAEVKLQAAEREIELLRSTVEKLNSELTEAYSNIDSLNEVISNSGNASRFSALKSELQTIKDTLSYIGSSAKGEFANALRAMNINPYERAPEGGYKWEKYFELLQNNSLTASQAIAKFKSEEQQMLLELRDSSGGLSGVDIFNSLNASLEKLSATMSTVLEKVSNLKDAGNGAVDSVGGAGTGNGVAKTGGELSQLTDFMNRLNEAAANTSGEMREAYASIHSVVESLTSYGNLDDNKLLHISQVFSGLGKIAEGSITKTTVSNIIALGEGLQKINQSGNAALRIDFKGLEQINGDNVKSISKMAKGLQELSSIQAENSKGLEWLEKISTLDFSKMKELKFSKAASANLTSFITSVTEKRVQGLQELTKLDFSNLNSLNSIKIDPGTVQAITELAKAKSLDKALSGASAGASGAGKAGSQATADAAGLKALADQIKASGELQKVARTSIDGELTKQTSTILDRNTGLLTTVTEIIGAEEELSRVISVVTNNIAAQEAEMLAVNSKIIKEEGRYNNVSGKINGLSGDLGKYAVTDQTRQWQNELIQLQQRAAQLWNGLGEDQSANGLRIYSDGMREISNQLDIVSGKIKAYIANQNEAAAAAKAAAQAQAKQLTAAQKLQGDLVKADARGSNFETAVNVQGNKILNSGFGDTAQAAELQARLDALRNSAVAFRAALDKDPSTDGLNAYNQGMTALDAEMKKVIADIQQYIAVQKNAKAADMSTEQYQQKVFQANEKYARERLKLEQDLQKFSKAKNGQSADAYKQLADTGPAMETLISRLNAGEITLQEFNEQWNELGRGAAAARLQITQAGEATSSFGTKLKSAFTTLASYFSLSRLMYQAISTVKEMVNSAIEIDTAMTTLQIVTGATDIEMAHFGSTISNVASELGQSITQVTGSIETFSRLGYSLGESENLTRFATIMSNIAQVDLSEATTGLTAIIKGYGMAATDAEHVSDVLIEVGQKFAVSASEMMEAYEKSGAALAATGTSFEKSAGLIAAANAAVQNASTVGTALKTVSARIRGSKSDLEELGEEVDDLVNGFSKYAAELKAITGFDIMVEGTTDQFKDLYDIMEGISKVWGSLTDTQQARTAEILGGTRQLTVISSIIQNWQDAEGAYKAAMDASGVALNAQAKYAETTAFKIEQLKAAMQELGRDIFDADTMNFFVELGTGIANAADKVVELTNKIGGLKTVVAAVGAYFSVILLGKIVTGIGSIVGKIKDLMSFFNGASMATVFANPWVLAAAAIATVVTAVVSVTSAMKRAREEALQLQRASAENTLNSAKEASGTYKNLSQLIEQYKQLKDASGGAWSLDQANQAKDIQDQIVSLVGDQAANIDLVNGALDVEYQKLLKIKSAQQDTTLRTAQEAYEINKVQFEQGYGEAQGLVSDVVKIALEVADAAEAASGDFWDFDYASVRDNIYQAIFGVTDMDEIQNAATDYVSALQIIQNAEDYMIAKRKSTPDFLGDNYGVILSSLAKRRAEVAGEITQFKESQQALYNAMATTAIENYIREGIIDSQETFAKKIRLAFILAAQQGFDGYGEVFARMMEQAFPEFAIPEDIKRNMIADMTELTQEIADIASSGEFKADSNFISKWLEGMDLDEYRQFVSWWTDNKDSPLFQASPEQLFTLNTIMEAFAASQQRVAEAVADTAFNYDLVVDKAKSAAESITKQNEALSKAISEQGENGAVSLETYNELITASADYADALSFENGQYVINAEAARATFEQKTQLQIEQVKLAEIMARIRAQELREMDELSDAEKAELTSLESQIDQYRVLRSELESLTGAYARWKAAQSGPDNGDLYSDIQKAYETIKSGLETGLVGTEKFKAAQELLLGEGAATEESLKALSRYFGADGDDSMRQGAQNFAQDLLDAGVAMGDLKDMSLVTGVTLEDLAAATGLTQDGVKAMLDLLSAYGFEFDWTDPMVDGLVETQTEIENTKRRINELADEFNSLNNGNVDYHKRPIISAEQMWAAGYTEFPAEDKATLYSRGMTIGEGEALYTIEVTPILEDGTTIKTPEQLQEYVRNLVTTDGIEGLLASDTEHLVINVQPGDYDEEYWESYHESIEGVKQEHMELTNQLNAQGINTGADEEALSLEALKAVADELIGNIEQLSGKDIGDLGSGETYQGLEMVQSLLSKIEAFRIHDKTFNVTVNDQTGGMTTGESGSANARGTLNAVGGRTLVGELGRELVVSDGRYFTVGDNGAEFVNLKPGDIVFNHLDTQRLLGSTRNPTGGAFAFAGHNKLIDIAGDRSAGVSGGGGFIDTLTDTAGDTGGKSGTTQSEIDDWFKRELAAHQHLLNMEAETDREYLEWLEKAFKKAYEENLITLEDYYKYEEEIYKKRKELAQDYISDLEHANSLLEHYTGTEQQRIENYKDIMRATEAEIKAAYERGLTDDDEYVQQLKTQWWEASDAIAGIMQTQKDNAKAAVEELIEYRISMIKKDYENEKDALNKKLKDLKDFYDKQKKMLKDAYDEEKYLEQQAEKRKDVTDIQAELAKLQFDNSAWAQKRRLELTEELKKAEKDLNDFEKDHALEVATDELDKQYEEQEKLINSQIEAIEEILNNPNTLWYMALADMRNFNEEMLQEMIQFNRKNGTGHDDTIWDMIESAYKATGLVGAGYGGVTIGDYTGYNDDKWSLKAWWDNFVESIKDLQRGSTKHNDDNVPKHANGTFNAPGGLSQIDELGSEYLFTSSNGAHYRVLNSGDKVLNAKATEFLYKFANNGGEILSALTSGVGSLLSSMFNGGSTPQVVMGDIIINGDTNEKTVSEIRRAQRESVEYMIKEFTRLSR